MQTQTINGVACVAVNGANIPAGFFGDLIDGFRLWRSGLVADLLKLYAAVTAKDWPEVRRLIAKIAADQGFPAEAKEIDELVAELAALNWPGVLYQAGDVMQLVATKYMGYVPPGGIQTDPSIVPMRQHYSEMSGVECRTWLADNRANVRESGRHLVVRWRLRGSPELLRLMTGEMTAEELAAIDPDRLARIIDVCRVAIPILTVAGAFFPPCLIAAVALKMIVAWYDANHPANAGAGNDADKGLSLADLL